MSDLFNSNKKDLIAKFLTDIKLAELAHNEQSVIDAHNATQARAWLETLSRSLEIDVEKKVESLFSI